MPFPHIAVDTAVLLVVLAGGRPSRGQYPQVDDEIWYMLERCWNITPSFRPSMAELHDFFTSQAASAPPNR